MVPKRRALDELLADIEDAAAEQPSSYVAVRPRG